MFWTWGGGGTHADAAPLGWKGKFSLRFPSSIIWHAAEKVAFIDWRMLLPWKCCQMCVWSLLHHSEDIVRATRFISLSSHSAAAAARHFVHPLISRTLFQTVQKLSDRWQMLCSYRRITCAYVQLPTQTGIRSRSRAAVKKIQAIFQSSPPKKSKKSQLAKVIIWHQVCFQPNACLAFFDSPLSCFVPSLLNSAPSSSPTCVTNWPESIWSFGIFGNIFTNKIWFDNCNRQSGKFMCH